MEPVSEQPKDNGEVGQKTENIGNYDDTVIFLLPGVLSPEVSMLPLKAYLKKQGFNNAHTIGLRWSIEKFEKLKEHAVERIRRQVGEYKKSHNGNNPDNLIIIGYSNGGKVGAEAIGEIEDQLSTRLPKLITLSTPAREGPRNYSPFLKKALSLTDSYHHKTVFPSEGWYSINSHGDKGATIERTTEDEFGNKPEEVVTTEQRLSHVQMINPRKTGPLLISLLQKIVK